MPDRLRLAPAVAVSSDTRYLDPHLLRGRTCVGVVGMTTGDVQVVAVDAPLLPWPHHRRHSCRTTSTMLHSSILDVVTGWKLDEVHPAVKNPGTVAVHKDVVLLLSAVNIIRGKARPGTTATNSSVARTSSLQCKTTSMTQTFSFLPSPVRRKPSAGSGSHLLTRTCRGRPHTRSAVANPNSRSGGLFEKI